jgi:methyl-accepting chemotaxis protein
MRSAEAAKNTSAMIEESVQSARNGVGISGDVAKMLEEITGAAAKVNSLVGEISAASQEQSQGIGQVNTSVSQMDQVTQSNAAGAEESAAASEELSSQAEQLKSVVGDLLVLVGGSRQNESSTPCATAARTKPVVSAPRKVGKPAVRPRGANPAAAIPLDDDAAGAGADFSEFDQKTAAA